METHDSVKIKIRKEIDDRVAKQLKNASFCGSVLDKFAEDSVEENEFKKKNKLGPPCKIHFHGKPIRLYSGKSIWRCKGHAKNALRNHLDTWYDLNFKPEYDSATYKANRIVFVNNLVIDVHSMDYYYELKALKEAVFSIIMNNIIFVELTGKYET